MANDNHGQHGQNEFRFQQLDIYIAARELAAVVHGARISDAELRDQASRASKSVFLNIAEGLPSDAGGIRRRHFGLANGSLCETVAAVDLALVIGAIAPEPAARTQALALRVKRMLRALTGGARAG
jgi:four helix bundle protein